MKRRAEHADLDLSEGFRKSLNEIWMIKERVVGLYDDQAMRDYHRVTREWHQKYLKLLDDLDESEGNIRHGVGLPYSLEKLQGRADELERMIS